MSRIDLYSHTTFSDGSCSPTELVDLAIQQGIDILSITDHDTTEGLPEALEATQDHSIETHAGD